MSLEEWMPLYYEIARELGLSPAEDRRATLLLSSLLQHRPPSIVALERLLAGRRAIVFGAGPSLERALSYLDLELIHERFTLLAANGATSALLDYGVVPHVICTDLDGRVEDQLRSNTMGSVAVVHAHGDNVPSLERYVPSLPGPVVGSTQVEPAPGVYNFGGFTDGDRCVFLALWGGATEVFLVGMDLGPRVGKYSKPWLSRDVEAWGRKAAKNRIARRLLEWLAERSRSAKLYVVEASISGFASISLLELTYLVEGF
ncbi:MAG: DUF115 domain-containing protein [Candidatus Nezhaarchaeota archaeon]|nr:DUF115 domain-containing protein [Candidatus Nezhaarchaeota archaeon]